MKPALLLLLPLASLLIGCADTPAPSTLPVNDQPAYRDLPGGRLVTFDRPDGPYDATRAAEDFGPSHMPAGRDHAQLRDGVLEVTFNAGKKVVGTGLGLYIPVPPGPDYEIAFRLRYPESFESGLHGKMIGLSGGRGYDGGRGAEARENGDGWSLRLQFDANPRAIRKTLYVYHAAMEDRYGGPHGATPFEVLRGVWHHYRVRVTMPSADDIADGRVRVWLDDELKIDVADILFASRPSGRQIDRVRLELFPGGGGLVPTRSHLIEIDDFSWQAHP